jgi:hypothetical protein
MCETKNWFEFWNLNLGSVSDWSETDASPDIRISDSLFIRLNRIRRHHER